MAAIREVVVEQFTQKPTRRAPPAPFTTSTFQQAASNSLKLGPKAAMDLAQALYDAGHISYHRTDNPNISEDSMPALRAAATAMGLEVVEERREFAAKDGAQIGHPGITPTYWDVECAGETPEQHAVYRLIRIRAIASQLLDAEYLQRSVVLLSQQTLNGKPLRFSAVGSTMTAPGWTQLIKGDSTKDDDDEEEEAPSLPELEVGMSLTASKGELVAKKTRAPKRYKEASLVKALEDLGIGRPATYAAIIEGIKARDYIKVGKGQFLSPTELGEQVVDGLVGKFQFMDLGFTRELEEDLDRIAAGQASAVEVLKRLHLQLESEISVQRSTVSAVVRNPCPECGKSMRRRKGGEKGFFWGCTGYPECSATLPDDNGKPGQRKGQELSNFECKLCSSRLVNLKKKGQFNFWRCSGEKKSGCNQRYQDVKGKPDYAGSK